MQTQNQNDGQNWQGLFNRRFFHVYLIYKDGIFFAFAMKRYGTMASISNFSTHAVNPIFRLEDEVSSIRRGDGCVAFSH